MGLISIDVDNLSEIKNFIISGDISELLNNKRIKLSLKRLGYSILADKIWIPFQNKTQIKTLQEIQRLLTKFGFEQGLTENIKNELESFNREEILFEKFSEKAMSIRNDEFKNNPELVLLFEQFQNILKKKIRA